MYPWLEQLIYSPGLHSKHFWFDFVPCCYYDIIVKFDFNFRITEILRRGLSRFYRMGFQIRSRLGQPFLEGLFAGQFMLGLLLLVNFDVVKSHF